MSSAPLDPFQSLVMVAWRRADYLVHQMVRALGLGLLPCKPFLLRPVRARLAADLARFEALTRRLLVLMVLEKGLPGLKPRAPAVASGKPPVSRVPVKRPVFSTPVFRLAEPMPREATTPPPRRPTGPLRPRILRLDQPLPPPEPWEYPPRADDLLPSQPLIGRLVALRDVFADPATHIARMARHLALSRATPTARRYKLAPLPKAITARRVSKDERESLLQLDFEARLSLEELEQELDTS